MFFSIFSFNVKLLLGQVNSQYYNVSWSVLLFFLCLYSDGWRDRQEIQGRQSGWTWTWLSAVRTLTLIHSTRWDTWYPFILPLCLQTLLMQIISQKCCSILLSPLSQLMNDNRFDPVFSVLILGLLFSKVVLCYFYMLSQASLDGH